MFDPVEFFHIARILYNESEKLDSGAARTCINRAYYAAHLVVREKYKIKDTGKTAHTAVIDYFKKRSPVHGNQLSTLFLKRKDADYKLDDSLDNPITKRDSGNAIKQAAGILRSLGKKVDD
jgi:uncharacterized protein (UPF0332 family)